MTVDMTNNRVPYGLLTDEEKAALHEHEKAGGVVQHYQANTWFNCAPSWLNNVIYRTVSLPKTQDVIAWDRLPEWAEWVARDENGRVFTLPTEPFISGTGWGVAIALTLYRRIDDFPGIVKIGTVDWKESKQRRPK